MSSWHLPAVALLAARAPASLSSTRGKWPWHCITTGSVPLRWRLDRTSIWNLEDAHHSGLTVHPGFGNPGVLQARLIASDGDAPRKILSDWQPLLEVSIREWGTDAADMRRAFEDTRNKWMDENEGEWLDLVKPYQNVLSTLKYMEVGGCI